MDPTESGKKEVFQALYEVRLGRWGPFFPSYEVRSGEACFCLLVCMPGAIGYHIVRVHICWLARVLVARYVSLLFELPRRAKGGRNERVASMICISNSEASSRIL